MFIVFLPVLFLFFVIVTISIILTVRRSQTAAHAEQTNPEQTVSRRPQAQPNAPARPTVQASVKPQQKQEMKPRIKQEPTVQAKPVPAPVITTVRAQEPKPVLTFTGSDAVRGILYAEILGKPKALRRS